jgi:hypothetical protein
MRRHKAVARLLALFAVLAVFACDRVTPVAPVGSTITISVNPSRIDAEGESATITIIVRKEDGTPVNPGTQVNVSTTLGEVDPEVTFTDETGVAKADLTGDGRIGIATVSATTGAAALVSVEVQIGSVAASITLTATPSNVPKDPQGDEGVIELLALIRDDTGAPLGGGIVNFAADTGTLDSRGGPVETNDLGEARDVLRVTRNDVSTLLDPFFLVSAETAIAGGSLILDELEIDIRGVPATLTLQVSPATIPEAGTGDAPLRLTALVRDNLGDPLQGVGVNFLTEAGTLSSEGRLIDTDVDGRAIDFLSASKDQLDAVPGTFFDVEAETAGLGGSLLLDSFRIQIESSDPVALFGCEVTNAAAREVRCTFTGRTLTACQPNSFRWTSTRVTTPPTTTAEETFTGGDLFVVDFTFMTPDIPYRIRLELSDECGTAVPFELQIDDFVP